MKGKAGIRVAVFLGILILSAAPVWGQAVASAEISGSVVDPSGAAVPNAKVTATQTATGLMRSTITSANGGYALLNIPVGPYKLQVSASGFRSYLQSGIHLQVGNNVVINVTLQVGAITQAVQVNANATMVETQNAAVSQVIDQRRILALPLNGRQATQLVLISGASMTAPSAWRRASRHLTRSTT